MSTGFTFPWEQEAQRGEPMPEGLESSDQKAFQALRLLYQSYREKRMDRADAVREKRLIRRAWEEERAERAFARKLALHQAEVNRRAELAKAACRKDPTPENALRLVRVLDGLEETMP